MEKSINVYLNLTDKGEGTLARTPKGLLYLVTDHNGLSDHLDYHMYITTHHGGEVRKILMSSDSKMIKNGIIKIPKDFLEFYVEDYNNLRLKTPESSAIDFKEIDSVDILLSYRNKLFTVDNK